MADVLTFAGQDLTQFVFIEKAPRIVHAQRDERVYVIPGRNGSYKEQLDTYRNYIQEYEVIGGGNTTYAAQGAYQSLMNALTSSTGYQILADNFEPDYYRLATFTGPMNADDILTRNGRCKLQFDCMPERYLVSGWSYVSITNNSRLNNPTGMVAKPIIKGTGSGYITINGKRLTITGYSGQWVIDCTMPGVYSQNEATVLDGYASGSFPDIAPGSNTVAISAFTNVTIQPRYWTV